MSVCIIFIIILYAVSTGTHIRYHTFTQLSTLSAASHTCRREFLLAHQVAAPYGLSRGRRVIRPRVFGRASLRSTGIPTPCSGCCGSQRRGCHIKDRQVVRNDHLGAQYGKLSPKWYARIFLTCVSIYYLSYHMKLASKMSRAASACEFEGSR